MSILLSFIQLISILVICIYEYKKQHISVFMWATLLIMFGLPHFISVVSGISIFKDLILLQASFFVISFNTVYFISKVIIDSIVKGNRKFSSIVEFNYQDNQSKLVLSNRDSSVVNLNFILLLFCLIIVLWTSYMYFGGIAASSWGNFYKLNHELGFSNPVKYAEFLFFAVAGVALVYKSWGKNIMFFIAILIIVCYSLITGNRITVLPAFMAFIIPVILNKKNRLSFRKVIFFSLMAVIVVYSVYFLRLVRVFGSISNFIENFDLGKINSMIFNMLLNGDGELGLRNAFYHFINIDNNFPGLNEGATYIRLLLILIPTRILEGVKPPDFAITMGSAYIGDSGNTTYSMHPTLYGDVFANFGWYGIIFGVFWAFLTYVICLLVNRNNTVIKYMLLVLFGTVFVIIARGSVYNGLFWGIESSVIIGIIYVISRIKFR